MLKEYHIDSWTEFKSYYLERLIIRDDLLNPQIPYLFRGEGDSSWRLISTFDRNYSGIDYETLLKYYEKEFNDPVTANQFPEHKAIFDEIRKNSSDMNTDEQRKYNLKTVALGQHYGLPTRLLDWSESPYIAAFFAFSKAIPSLANSSWNEIMADEKEAVIWALEYSNKWEEKGLYIHKPERDGNHRLFQQKGYVTEFKKDVCDESSLENLMRRTDVPYVIKFYVPVSESAKAIKDLGLMGINSTQIYGDLEGRSRSALNNAIIEKLKL